MGSSSSKFRKHLQHGDEYAALQLYNNNGDLRKALDPNLSYGDNHAHDTALHLTARHGMKALIRTFLFRHGGNPNKKNSRNETTLHSVCMTSAGRNFVVQQKRADCLLLVLQWTGPEMGSGELEKVDLGAVDEKNNTALHYAAASGLKRCVELLVSHNAPLFMENTEKQTPCDCADKCGHNDIALYLESKMVFSGEDEEPDNLEMETILDQMDVQESYSGLRAQDLQEAKDQLLVETSDMLRVPLFTAEALLRNHEWSRETLLEAWMEDPIACCDKCGVVPPASVCEDTLPPAFRVTSEDHELTTPLPGAAPPAVEVICDICACLIPPSDGAVSMTCDHQFCRECWKRYLTGKIHEGEAHNITCPGYSCTKLVPVDVIETLVARDTARRYLQFDIKAFVDSNPSIKWCPYPGCGRAVRLPDSDNPLSPSFRGMHDPNITNDFSHAVDCGNSHIFCWECLGEAHEPSSCENWQKWYHKMAEIKPEELSGTEEETEIAANCLWLVTNSKNCPNCKSPIQKNEGCNHMKCSKCKHDFCWVCLEQWKRHSSSTGGYFRCNRYEVLQKVREGQDCLKSDAEATNKKMQELNRFVHYYSRFKNHENSFKLEEPLLTTAKEKMMVLAKAVTDTETANAETKFVEDAVHQLLKGRRVLKCSYVYGFYLGETGYKKPIFEFMQTELEECIETLAEMIARPYLRTPRSKIIQAAALMHRKRHEFLTAISKGLVPTDTSPSLRKKKGRYTKELDEDLKKALLESLADIDPANPWVKDSTGKHTNVSALLDWPEEEDESENESESMESTDLPSGGESVCAREGCKKPRAKNPRTGDEHKHCSISCWTADRRGDKLPGEPQIEENFVDYQMDLLRALEMSRLQFMREMGQLRPGSSSSHRSSVTSRNPNVDTTSGDQATTSISSIILQDVFFPDPPENSLPNVAGTSADSPLVFPGLSIGSPPLEIKRPSTSSLYSDLSDSPVILHPPPRTSSHNAPPDQSPTSSPSSVQSLEPLRRGRVQSEPGERPGMRNKTASGAGELARAVELSRLSLHDEDKDLRLAIQLSLQDSLTNEKIEDKDLTLFGSQVSCKSLSKCEDKIQRNPDYWTMVNRVPNRSVEDLAQDGTEGLDNLGACGGIPLSSQSNKSTNSHSSSIAPNSFGLIKDISVTNINVDDEDKTKAFEDKRFAFMNQSNQYSKSNKNIGDVESTMENSKSRSGNFHDIGSDGNITPAPEIKNVLYLTKRQNYEINNVNSEPAARSVCGTGPTKSFTLDPKLNNAPHAATSLTKTDSLDPADIHIDSNMLESMIQGADGYQGDRNRVEMSRILTETREMEQDPAKAETVLLLEKTNQDLEMDNINKSDDDDEEAVFV